MTTRAELLEALRVVNAQIDRLGAQLLLTTTEAADLSDRALEGWVRRSRIYAETVAQALTGIA